MNNTCISRVKAADQSENVDYNCKEYPVYIRTGALSQYPNYSAVSHWHEDLEFVVILSGHMTYNVNGETLELMENNGILVNSRQFHHGYSRDFTECTFLCILLHPSILCVNEYFEHTYVTPVIADTTHPYLMLSRSVPWQEEILKTLLAIHARSQEENAILSIQQSVFTLWLSLCPNFPKQPEKPIRSDRQLTAVKKMVAFIQAHYKERLSLAMIAEAGNVCKSSCSALFRKYLRQTPVSYMTEYRLNRSIDLLLTTDLSVTEISYAVGFNGASYYSETFRKYYRCTPTEYVKRQAQRL